MRFALVYGNSLRCTRNEMVVHDVATRDLGNGNKMQ